MNLFNSDSKKSGVNNGTMLFLTIMFLLLTTATTCSRSSKTTVTTNTTTTAPAGSNGKCKSGTVECTGDSKKERHCQHGGVCCQHKNQRPHCECPTDYEGDNCEHKATFVVLESHDRQMSVTALTSGLSLGIATIAVIALIIIAVIFWRGYQRRQQKVIDRAEDLDKELDFVQGQLAKLSPAAKMTRLTRLSKIVEATARAAVLSYPALISQTTIPVARPTNSLVLPRWSSAPCGLDQAADQFSKGSGQDVSSNVEKRSGQSSSVKKARHQVFSI